MLSLVLAAVLGLQNGLNNVTANGEVSSLEVVTQEAAPTISLKSVNYLAEFTNAYETVTTRHMRYDFTITNYDGGASIATNVLDKFSYADWVTTNGLNMIIGKVDAAITNISEVVVSGKALKAEYFITNDIASVTASGHYGITNSIGKPSISGRLLVDGAKDGDTITILVK